MNKRTYLLVAVLWIAAASLQAQTEAQDVVDALQATPTTTVFARLLQATGYDSPLRQIEDVEYRKKVESGVLSDIPWHQTEGQSGTIPARRRYGFTVFAETDATFEAALGKSAADITAADVRNYLVTTKTLPNATNDDNFTHEQNILNQFVSYHLLPQRLPYDKLVIHYNETGYNFATSRSYTIPVMEYYTTMGLPRLLKVYESLESKGIYLNRFPDLRDGVGKWALAGINDNHESGQFRTIKGKALTVQENVGIRVPADSDAVHSITALNGIIYPIQQLLVCTENVIRQLASERMRMDFTSLLPEMSNNDLRRPMQNFVEGAVRLRGFHPGYFENLLFSEQTYVYYLTGYDCNWMNYQGDEFNILGMFDVTVKLPPVPDTGDYEIRLAIQSNSSLRSIAQALLMEEKEVKECNVVDFRVGGLSTRFRTGSVPNNIGWEEDTGFALLDAPNDRQLRSRGFLKGPNSYCYQVGSMSSVRSYDMCLRRILFTAHMEAGKTYYLRLKSMLNSPEKQLYLDFLEYCPLSLAQGITEAEDIW